MPHWDRVTPALYGIATKIAPPVIRGRWDELILPVLQDEEGIYNSALDAFAISRSKHLNAACGLEIFLVLLRHEGFEFVSVSTGVSIGQQPIPNAVFDVYWYLARDSDYWQPGCHAQFGQQISYNLALQKWGSRSPELIDWCEENLELWLSTN